MDKPIRILILEDNPADAELVQFELEEAGINFTAKVVMTEKDFISELQESCPDIILSDYDLPKYSGALALAETRRRCPDTPFILVTGAVTEDRAIEILTGGAKDYVMKNRLSRLVPAVRRALTEAGEHRARKEAEEELRVASLYSRSLLEASLDPLVTISPDGKVMDVNKATEEATGVSRDQIIGNDFADYFTEPEKARAGFEKAFSNGSLKDFPLVLRHISGRITDVLYNATTYKNEKGEIQGIFAAARDVTELKAAEAELRETHKVLEEQVRERTHELQESKERLSLALTSSGMGIFEWDIIKNKRYFDESTFLLLGIKPESFTGTTEEFFSVIHPDDRQAVQNALNRATEESGLYETDYRVIWPDGSIHHIAVRGRVQRNMAGRPIRLAGVCWEITERRRTQDRLQKQAELLNMSYEAIFIWEHDGAIIYWNKRAEQLYGYTSDEAVGQVSHDLLKTKHTKGMGYVKDILIRNTTWSGELIHTTKDGKTLTVESRHQLTKDEFGRLIVLETNRDITRRKKAEEALRQSEERFRTMANSIQQLAWIARADGFITWYNQRWYEYTGTTPEQMEGWGWQSVHDPELLPAVMKKWKMSLATGEPFDMEFPLLGADGVFRPFLTRGMPLKDDQGRVIQWFGTNTDLSDRKREEEELQKKASQLEAGNKELESFSYSVSHDLRAPLRAIDGYSRMILKKYGDTFSDDVREKFEVIRDNTRAMGQLIDDLLTLSRAGRQEIEKTVLDIRQLIEKTWQELQTMHPDREMELKIDSVPPVWCDRALIKQVFVNLLSNAIKFTGSRKRALVEVGGYEKDNEVICYVKDNGAGFDMQYKDKLFGVFQRLHGASEYEGTGIGLAIVQRIIHHHGGRVWAEGKVDEGAVFYFTLPLKEG